MNDFQPKCYSCVDGYREEFHCSKSIYCGMDIDKIPWEGCSCFLSRRKWDGYDFGRKKEKEKTQTEVAKLGGVRVWGIM